MSYVNDLGTQKVLNIEKHKEYRSLVILSTKDNFLIFLHVSPKLSPMNITPVIIITITMTMKKLLFNMILSQDNTGIMLSNSATLLHLIFKTTQ